MKEEEVDEELVGNSPSQKNWRGILIALLVILIVLALIVVAVILVTPKHEELKLGDPFTFEDVFNPLFQPKQFVAKWIGDKDVYVYRSREGELMEYDAALDQTNILMENFTFRQLNTDLYYVSEDLNYVLLAYDIKPVYRHSFKARYKIYDRHQTDPKRKLLAFPSGSEWEDKLLQYADWATKGNALAFVYENNVWYQKDPSTDPVQLTDSGQEKFIFNGIPDWVYEEEILGSSKAHWWSPDGTHICYAEFNDTTVPLYKFPVYGDGTSIYGQIDEIAYPKAGDEQEDVNPTFTLFVVDPNDPSKRKVFQPPEEFADKSHYFTHVAWQDTQHVYVTWSNRAQNKSLITLCDINTGECKLNLVQLNSEGRGWVDIPNPLFIDDGLHYLTVLPERDGSYGYWRHVAMVTSAPGEVGVKAFLTQGTWDVTKIVGYNQEEKLVYFISTNGDARKRHLFRVGTPDSLSNFRRAECLTCDFPEDCQYISTSFSKSAKYYILNCQGPGVPSFTLRSTVDSTNITLEDNAELRSKLQSKAMPVKEYFEIDTEDGHKIWAQAYLPPRLNKEHITKYPLLVNVYGGPGTQQVTEQFHLGWDTYMVSSENVIYMSIDGRGSGARGDRYLHSVYRQLGTNEVQDQITATKYLMKDLNYVDEERVGIWGWSYGGFATSHVIGDPSDVINCGVAVAPVTDWRYYDTVYTERYMGFAHSNDNYRGYDNANVSRKAVNFRGKKFMLIHGTADDNVHFQHTAQFIKALTEAEVDFRIQVYSDKNHAITGPKTSLHLYRTLSHFFKEVCWDGGEPRDVRGDQEEEEEVDQ